MNTHNIIPIRADAHGEVGEPQQGEIAGRRIVYSYGDAHAEYAAMRAGALLVDRSYRGRTIFPGDKAREVLAGLVTNDVLALPAGAGAYAAALTAKGKIIADVRVFARTDDVLVDVPPRAFAGWSEMLRKYVNPRLVKFRDVSADIAQVGVYGIDSVRIVSEVLELPPEQLAGMLPFANLVASVDGMEFTVARVPDVGLDAFEIFVGASQRDAMRTRLALAGGRCGGVDALEIARVEAGRPEWGIDMDESTIPQEANMDELHAISYTKGCYTGQETVARVHFRGHVNRHIRGIRHASETPVPAGAVVEDATGKAVGEIRSSVTSPRLGGLALAMLRREVEVPSNVTLKWDDVTTEAMVHPLPFPL